MSAPPLNSTKIVRFGTTAIGKINRLDRGFEAFDFKKKYIAAFLTKGEASAAVSAVFHGRSR